MDAPAGSIKAVVAALSGNAFVTVVKFIAFFSAADTGNQVQLFRR